MIVESARARRRGLVFTQVMRAERRAFRRFVMSLRFLTTLGWCTLAVTACTRTADAARDEAPGALIAGATVVTPSAAVTPLAVLNNSNSHIEWLAPDLA